MYDVHIVGGGPSGCFAGIAACQAGKNALLSEEHSRIGEPEACSGLISKSGLESISGYVDYRKVAINEIKSAKFVSGKQEMIIAPKEETAVLVSRAELDVLAAERYEQVGGKLELGRKVTREFASQCVIGADGPASAVADCFGFPKIRSYVAGMQGDFAYRCEDPHQTEVHFSSKEFPGFFGWVIPKNESEAKIGLAVKLPLHPLKYYRSFLAKLGVSGKPSHEFAAVIPTSVRRKTAIQKGGRTVLLCGDSAGQVKATTGGGIFFSSQCGLLAGKHCNEPEKYEHEWKSKYGLDLALHRHFRSLLDLNGGQPSPLILSAAKAMFFEDLLSERGKMDRWSEMLQPSILSAYAGIIGNRITGVKK